MVFDRRNPILLMAPAFCNRRAETMGGVPEAGFSARKPRLMREKRVAAATKSGWAGK